MKISNYYLQTHIIDSSMENTIITLQMLDSKSEQLGSGGVKFNPENSENITDLIHRLLYASKLRSSIASTENMLPAQSSWKDCADDTIEFFQAKRTRSQQ